MTEVDCQVSMVGVASGQTSLNTAARFKNSWQFIGVGTALATGLGAISNILSVGSNAGAAPVGWNSTIQLDTNKNNALVIASIGTAICNVKAYVQYGYSR